MLPGEALVLLVGEASAGKTVFLYRLAEALAHGKEFLGHRPPRPVRVLHLDVESPRSVERTLLATIRPHSNWTILKVQPRHLLRALRTLGRNFDVIIVDSLQVALPVRDENNNAEGSRQMLAFVDVARRSRAAVIVAHNSGEGNPKEKFKARGATARVDRADIVLNLDNAGRRKRRLKVVKSRFGNLEDSLEFAFTPEGFDYRLTKSLEQPATKLEAMERTILATMRRASSKTALSRKTLAKLVKIDPRSMTAWRLFDRALKDLVQDQKLHQPQRGKYATAPSGRG
jgi:archaellum biogenesis ATPase FlaH